MTDQSAWQIHRDAEALADGVDIPRLASFASWIRSEIRIEGALKVWKQSDRDLVLQYESSLRELEPPFKKISNW